MNGVFKYLNNTSANRADARVKIQRAQMDAVFFLVAHGAVVNSIVIGTITVSEVIFRKEKPY